MTENLVPAKQSHHTAADLYNALRTAAPELSRVSLLVLLAQWDLETGGGVFMWCNNIGNAKHVPGDGHDYCAFRHNEIIDGKEIWIDPPNDPFRAYSTLADGAKDYLAMLQREFRAAWPAVLAGDPAAFVRAIKAAHYFTGDEASYQRNVVALDAQLARELPQDPPLSDVARQAILDAGAPDWQQDTAAPDA